MPFINDAQQAVQNLAPGNPLRLTLEFLLANGGGRNNARPMGEVLDHLAANGVVLTGPRFQTSVLKQTRLGSIFIGSGPRGYFLIETPEDAMVMRDFYQSRIASEQLQLDHLRDLAAQMGWQL
jgi:hypothetical protein